MANTKDFSAFTKEDVEAARNIICKEAPDEIIRLILHRCAQLGCDPLAKMVYAVLRKGKWQLQSSIDLFRSIASADADYGGQDGPFWCGQDGIWKDVWLDKSHPSAAKVGVYRKGFSAATYAVANWDAYEVTGDQGFMWRKMPALMLAKTAEALALRKAFPQKLSGLYTNDEMDQADNGAKVLPTAPVALPAAIVGNLDLQPLMAAGKALGKLAGAVHRDLQNNGGDVLALKVEYENALAEKNPRGTLAASVAVPTIGEPSKSDNAPAVDGEAGTEDAKPSPNTQAILSLMQAFLHPDVQKHFAAHADQLSLATAKANRPITALSQLTPEEAAKVVSHLKQFHTQESGFASDSDILQVQITLKDTKIVDWLKTSKAYKAAQEAKETQADSLRLARLAFAAHVLKHPVSTLKEVTSEEVKTLIAACKKFKEPQNG